MCKPNLDFRDEFFLALRQTTYTVRWVKNSGTDSINGRAVWIMLSVRAQKGS